MKTKVCSGCNKRRRITKFPPDKRAKDGKQARCRKCICEFVKGFYKQNPARMLVVRAKRRAIEKKFEFDLHVDDILPLPTHCPVLGLELRHVAAYQDPHAYSLDRVDNTKGYVRGNVVVMSYLANRLKNDGTAEQHEKIAAWMRVQGCS